MMLSALAASVQICGTIVAHNTAGDHSGPSRSEAKLRCSCKTMRHTLLSELGYCLHNTAFDDITEAYLIAPPVPCRTCGLTSPLNPPTLTPTCRDWTALARAILLVRPVSASIRLPTACRLI
jgi:hypothetical protein